MPIGNELVVDDVYLVFPEVPILIVDIYIVESIHPSVWFVPHVVRVPSAETTTALTFVALLHIQWGYDCELLYVMRVTV